MAEEVGVVEALELVVIDGVAVSLEVGETVGVAVEEDVCVWLLVSEPDRVDVCEPL